jgi:hypothetical protein
MASVVFTKPAFVLFLFKKSLVFLPRNDQLTGFNQARIWVDPFSLPLVTSNMFDDPNPLQQGIFKRRENQNMVR